GDLPVGDQPVLPPHRGRGAAPGAAVQEGRPALRAPAGDVQPPLRGEGRLRVPVVRHQDGRPHPGGEHRPDEGGAEVRPQQGHPPHLVRGVVDPRVHPELHPQELVAGEAGDHPGAAEAVLLPGAHPAGAGEAGRGGRVHRRQRGRHRQEAPGQAAGGPRDGAADGRPRPVAGRAHGRGRGQQPRRLRRLPDRRPGRRVRRQGGGGADQRAGEGGARPPGSPRALHHRAAGDERAADDAQRAGRALRLLPRARPPAGDPRQGQAQERAGGADGRGGSGIDDDRGLRPRSRGRRGGRADTLAPALLRLLESVFPVRAGERKLTSILFLQSLLAVGAFVAGRSVRDALFLAHGSRSQLAWMYVASAGAVTAVGLLYNPIAARVRRDLMAIGSAALFAAAFVALWLVERRGAPWVYAALYVYVEVMGALTLVQFWTLCNELFNAREAKRLYRMIGAGGTLSNVIIGLLTSKIALRYGASALLPMCAALLLGCGVTSFMAGAAGRQRLFARAA